MSSETRISSSSNKAATRHWNRKPVGCQRSSDRPGEGAYFEEMRQYRYGYETPFIPSAFHFDDLDGKRVLEIGVGNGIDAVEMMNNGAEYWGLDITEKHLQLTQQNIEQNVASHEKKYKLINGDLLALDLDTKFDAVYSFGVLHHITHELDYLKKFHDLLEPDGTLRIALYSKYSFFNTYLFVSWILKNRCKVPFSTWQSHIAELTKLDEPVTIKIRSRAECERLLNDAGFAVKEYSKKGFTQNNVPVLGKFMSPAGPVLNGFARLLGWYHVFIAVR
jgi:SAM-dependent methyltransferase